MRLLGNGGVLTPNPGEMRTARCGICSAQMNVTRNVFGSTSWAEAIARRKHLHDRFVCPSYSRKWHERAGALMLEALEVRGATRKALIRRVLKILETHR